MPAYFFVLTIIQVRQRNRGTAGHGRVDKSLSVTEEKIYFTICLGGR